MYSQTSLDCDTLLKWCKLLNYDFFRLYSQHLILYSPTDLLRKNKIKTQKTNLPQFRKSLYTIEIIEFVLGLLESGEKSRQQIIQEYNIPKTTLYKWINKYPSNGT
ncbi:Helix-turn-helix domain of resolvase [Chryseobacterium oleae]|uniref:Helix-turn-helix domain of resolvase n=1 Tax=Chryseobacterium oleae TaxID=491207 RepID=A0A1I4YRV5_CHROL|nr:helix-turn-helix domain-containing protein [Chryseobacterium oleae]SFN40765.1 Helix-turn-helix domain of resolvase [Chryseobacterium oleae]